MPTAEERAATPSESAESNRTLARWTRTSVRIEAITSVFVGALALAISTYNVYLQREQIRAQVWPHLEWMYSEGDHFQWQLANSGVGPAIVKGVRMTVEGKPATSWKEAIALLEDSDPELRAARGAHRPASGMELESFAGRVIGAGVTIHPATLTGVTSGEAQPAFRRAYERLHVEICYCSTLQECWMLPGSLPVASCPTAGFTFN